MKHLLRGMIDIDTGLWFQDNGTFSSLKIKYVFSLSIFLTFADLSPASAGGLWVYTLQQNFPEHNTVRTPPLSNTYQKLKYVSHPQTRLGNNT